ncbi:hypothetical protein COT52_02295 [candidate division WWE3 bacterium CG08_land_8_20_14_0_20_43_13]|uniref:Uncharacterized protein n=1 Tax=candidate division WWE3 bacterium CG08_land_8_20_14_0_20_43_13 TaxID=1975087 RepID=A0A2H0X714_UNCKA|nr:MAG: hypothetical protein COT52_02295 [candidate division WWE3 bacterium CG08_land_8_20_14_0_20_43_13]
MSDPGEVEIIVLSDTTSERLVIPYGSTEDQILEFLGSVLSCIDYFRIDQLEWLLEALEEGDEYLRQKCSAHSPVTLRVVFDYPSSEDWRPVCVECGRCRRPSPHLNGCRFLDVRGLSRLAKVIVGLLPDGDVGALVECCCSVL